MHHLSDCMSPLMVLQAVANQLSGLLLPSLSSCLLLELSSRPGAGGGLQQAAQRQPFQTPIDAQRQPPPPPKLLSPRVGQVVRSSDPAGLGASGARLCLFVCVAALRLCWCPATRRPAVRREGGGGSKASSRTSQVVAASHIVGIQHQSVYWSSKLPPPFFFFFGIFLPFSPLNSPSAHTQPACPHLEQPWLGLPVLGVSTGLLGQ